MDNVLNGQVASHGSNGFDTFPHTVSLQSTYGRNRHFCGASIIHPRILVSAARCFKDYKPPYIQGVAGEWDLETAAGRVQVRSVSQLIIHEMYTASTHDNDIALVVLNESVKFDKYHVRPVLLLHPMSSLPG